MHIDQITADTLRRLLRSWVQGSEPPGDFKDLYLLNQAGDLSPAEKELRLHDLLQQMVEQHLHDSRLAGNIPPVPLQADARLAADFMAGDPQLEAWSAVYYRYFDPQPRTVEDFIRIAGMDERQLRRRVELGLNRLAEELRRAEMQAQEAVGAATKRLHIQRHLPPVDYRQLFGVTGLLDQVVAWLTGPDGPRFVSVEGLGGIGKTALAQAVARQLAGQAELDDIIWISARQEYFVPQDGLQIDENPARSLDDLVTRLADQLGQERLSGLPTADKLDALRNLLPQRPYLIVLDNLETLDDAHRIPPAFHALAGATRFLLTSRHSLSRFAYVQALPVPELSLALSQALLEKELDRRGSRALLTEKALAAIYQIVGGVPLALKLLAAQLGRLPLDYLLQGFQTAQRPAAGALYSYIYRRTWTLLDDPARQLLLAMLDISPEGEDLEWLQAMSSLPAGTFETALNQLIDYSLLEISGSLDSPVYRLHRITTTFLHTEILQDWSAML